jgi:hypothetical protein
MPGATLHLTHVEMLARDASIPELIRAAMEEEINYARFGSVLVDFPFYTNIWTMMLGYWLELPAEKCPFAQQMHRYHPDLFSWHFLVESRREGALSEAQRLALLGGFFSHVALDLELHPLVNWCARRDVILRGGVESHQHRLAEKYQSLFFHREVLGADIVGEPRLFTRRTQVVDYASFFRTRVDHPLVRWCTDTLAGFFHEAAPSRRQFAAWIRSFRHFAFMISLPFAKENSNRLGNPENRALYYDCAEFSFMDFFWRGYERSVQLLRLAHDAWVTADFSAGAREAFLAAAAIDNLADPPARGLPALPDYPSGPTWRTSGRAGAWSRADRKSPTPGRA